MTRNIDGFCSQTCTCAPMLSSIDLRCLRTRFQSGLMFAVFVNDGGRLDVNLSVHLAKVQSFSWWMSGSRAVHSPEEYGKRTSLLVEFTLKAIITPAMHSLYPV